MTAPADLLPLAVGARSVARAPEDADAGTVRPVRQDCGHALLRKDDVMLDKTETRTRLTERLAALMAQVGRIESEFGQPLDDDFAEQVVDREDDQALDALEDSALVEIEQIRAAIARLDTGSYGICTSCGNAIAAERLNALPAAAECIGCATAGNIAKR